jgi:DNA topoisomerase-3
LKTGGKTYMKLVIAEKPSVAISIAKVIGATKKKEGYYERNGYKVSWCVGHLIQMSNPDAYDEKYVKWNIEDLPLVPETYKYEVAKSTKKQFNPLKKLLIVLLNERHIFFVKLLKKKYKT